MNLMQLSSNLGGDIPTERRANHGRAQDIEARLVIAHHESEILRHVLEQDF